MGKPFNRLIAYSSEWPILTALVSGLFGALTHSRLAPAALALAGKLRIIEKQTLQA